MGGRLPSLRLNPSGENCRSKKRGLRGSEMRLALLRKRHLGHELCRVEIRPLDLPTASWEPLDRAMGHARSDIIEDARLSKLK